MAENVSDFLLENVDNEPETEEIKFKGFKSPFKIRSISAEELDELTKKNTHRKLDKRSHQITSELDQNKFAEELVVKAVVSPDLNNAQLQKSWGIIADPGKLLRKMLLAGQYGELVQQIQELSGFDAEDLTSLVDEAKK